MYYPKELFSINETQTQRNMAEYEQKQKKWYEAAEKLFPNYFRMNLKERIKIRQAINDYVGYSI